LKNEKAQQKHSPDGKKRGGADAASLGGPLVMQVVLGGYAAENRGADFVQHLVLSPCARTRHWSRLRFSEPQGASTLRLLRCSRVSAAIRIIKGSKKGVCDVRRRQIRK
jgi:hypothetical protein